MHALLQSVKKLFVYRIFFIVPISADSSNFSNKRSSPRIDKFYTSILEKDNWVMVPKDTKN